MSLDRLSPVEAKPQDQQNQGTSVDAHKHEHAHSQVQGDQKAIQQVAQQREDEYLKGALDTINIDREQLARLEIEKTHKGIKQNASQNRPYIDLQEHYEVIPGAADLPNRPPHQNPPPYRPPGTNERQVLPSTGASSARPRGVHAYDSPNTPRRELQKMRDQRSIQYEHLLGHHSGGGGGSNVPLRHQRSMPGPSAADEYQNLHPRHDLSDEVLYGNIPDTGGVPQQQFQPHEEWHQGDKPTLEQLNKRHQSDNQASMYYQANRPLIFHRGGGGAEVALNFQPLQSQYMHQQQQQGVQQQGMQRTQQLQHHSLQQHEVAGTQQPYNGTHISNTHLPYAYYGANVVTPPGTISHSFSVGSTVQLPTNPPRYGVIQWMGLLPGIDGRIAGVELVS